MQFFVFFFLCAVIAFPALADDETCQKARSTADIMRCVSHQNEQVENALNKAYEEVLRQTDLDQQEPVKNTQSEWVEYRKKACSLEAEQASEESLKRIEELRCLNRIAQERMEALEKLAMSRADKIEEAHSQPLWMNALAQDHPKVFWRLGEVQMLDSDCDGEDEVVLTGLRVADDSGALTAVLGITEDPVTGRPQNQAFEFPVQEQDEDSEIMVRSVCAADMKADFLSNPQASEEGAGEICAQALIISDDECQGHVLYWDGQNYVFENSAEQSEE